MSSKSKVEKSIEKVVQVKPVEVKVVENPVKKVVEPVTIVVEPDVEPDVEPVVAPIEETILPLKIKRGIKLHKRI